MNKILIITDENSMFHQRENIFVSLDIFEIKEHLESDGFEVVIKKYSEVRRDIENFKGFYIFYTSTYDEVLKKYIHDTLLFLGDFNKLIPSIDLFLSHENKSYQELYKTKCDIKSLKAEVYLKKNDISLIEKEFNYPFILKKANGAGGTTVFKIKSRNDFIDVFKKINNNKVKFNIKVKNKIKNILKKYFNIERQQSIDFESSEYSEFVIQEYIPNLNHDWKVLIFGNILYALKRGVPDGDFRASGQGILFYNEKPSKKLISSAFDFYHKLDAPHISLDLAEDQNGMIYLIEYQANAFGPVTMLNSNICYDYIDEVFIESKHSLEYVFALSISEYIKKKYIV